MIPSKEPTRGFVCVFLYVSQGGASTFNSSRWEVSVVLSQSFFFFVQPLWCFFFVFFLMSKQEERREQKEKSTHDIHTVNSTYASNIRSQSTHKKKEEKSGGDC